MRGFVIAILMYLLAFSVEPAETTYHCSHFQKDINYWQEQYRVLDKKNESLYKELMEAKMEILKQGIKIPSSLKNAEIIVNKKKQPVTHNHHYY